MTTYKKGEFHTAGGKYFFTEYHTSAVYLVVRSPENVRRPSVQSKSNKTAFSAYEGGLFKILCAPLPPLLKKDGAGHKSIYLVKVCNSERD